MPKPVRRKIFLWKKADLKGIKQDITDFRLTLSPDCTEVTTHWDSLKSMINNVIEKRVPSKMSSNRHTHPWINTAIKKAIRRKQRAHKKAKETNKKKDLDRYRKLQKEVKLLIKQSHQRYLEEIVSDDYKTNNKKFWSYIKSKKQDSVGVAPLKNKDGYLNSTNIQKAKILNEQFRTAFTDEDLSHIPSKGSSPFPAIDKINVGENGLRKLLLNLKTDKAT